MNKALIETATGRCVNTIVIGGNYTPPEGHELQTIVGAEKNKIWNGTDYDPVPQSHFDELDETVVSGFRKSGRPERAILQAFFEHENRIRVLEARSPVTISQVYDWFKSKIRGA